MNHDAGPPSPLSANHSTHAGAARLALAALFGLAAGGAAVVLGHDRAHPWEPLLWGWCTFAAVALLLVARVVGRGHPSLRSVEREDPSSLLLLLLVLGGCALSLLAVGAVLIDLHERPAEDRLGPGLLATATVSLSWLLIHVRFGFHYAHRFVAERRHVASPALQFPGDHPPDYGDFLYFSFGIGMTSQVSDVQVATRAMRRLVLWHSLLSFAFNLLILALGINAVAGAL